MLELTKRNIKIFSRDKGAVFLAFFSIILIIALYSLFLFNTLEYSLKHSINNPTNLITTFTISGLLAVSNITCTTGALQIFVEDKSSGILRDFIVIFEDKNKIFFSYFLSSFFIGNIVTIITLIVGQIYILIMGGKMLSLVELFSLLFLIEIALLSSISMLYFFSLFFKSNKAYSTANTVIGVTIGFISGVYIPIGSLPQNLQWIVKITPASHQAALFKTVLMQNPINEAFGEANVQTIKDFSLMMGVYFEHNGTIINNISSFLYLIMVSVLFLGLAYFVFNKKIRNV